MRELASQRTHKIRKKSLRAWYFKQMRRLVCARRGHKWRVTNYTSFCARCHIA
ncbi:MAG: hypothetical protein QOE77_3049 [Blastocatellia bacterium]|jgi:hypothetical protein|nr:hypothetical protein [Blastocatellia bacterium]